MKLSPTAYPSSALVWAVLWIWWSQGKNGWLFDPGHVEALAAILKACIEEGRQSLPPTQNFVDFQIRTTPDSVAAQYEDLYQTLIGRGLQLKAS